MGYVGSARQEVGIFHLHWPNDHFHLCFRRAEDYWQSQISARDGVFASGVDISDCDHPFSSAAMVESCIAKQNIP